MKKKLLIVLCLYITATLLPVTAAATSSFPDVPDDAAYAEAVEYLNSAGIMVGDKNGNFNPDATVTRAAMAAVICRMLDEIEDLPSREDFSDVPVGHWANGYISKAVELGIVNGYGDGTFKPSNAVTYEQALTMVVRAMALEEEATQAGGYPDGYIKIASEHGYIDQLTIEKGVLLTRWQVAIILYNAAYSIL